MFSYFPACKKSANRFGGDEHGPGQYAPEPLELGLVIRLAHRFWLGHDVEIEIACSNFFISTVFHNGRNSLVECFKKFGVILAYSNTCALITIAAGRFTD